MPRPATVVEHDVQYRQIFEATTDGLVVNDPETGAVVEVNPAFCRMHGYAYDELIGIAPTAFIHPDDHHLFAAFLEAFRTGEPFHAHARDVRRDGSVFDVEVRAEAFMFRGKMHLLGVVRDVSDAARAARLLEERVEERTRELAALVHIAREVAVAGDVPELIRRTLARTRGIVESDGAYLYLLRDAAYVLEHGEGPPAPAAITRAAIADVAAELDRGASVLVRDDDAGPRLDAVTAAGLRPPGASLILAPLRVGGETIGFLALHRVCDDHDGAPRAMELAEAIGSQIAIAVTNARLAETARTAAALDERHRIARDLHDAVSQTLFSATMHARAAEMAVAKLGVEEDHPARRNVADLAGLTLGALAEMRALIFELRPGALREAGVAVAVAKHAAALTARHGVAIEVRAPEDRLPLAPAAEEELYRIAQEALANVIRHAAAQRVVVELWESEAAVVLRVSDDGRGFDAAADHPGHLGLRTMAERAARAGGGLEVTSRPGAGTVVVARVPARSRP